jgi:tetratricopeptide (TPR) repeat protein
MNFRSVNLRSLGAGAVIFAATLLAYLPAVRGGFLWDDDGHVTREDLRSVGGLERIWGEMGATQQYYPLLHSAFWVEHRLWGDSVVGYHLTNILLHALAACLVVALVRRLALPGAWLAGLIFALHPVCVESVAWISEQKNTLSTVFYLGAALVYLRFDQDRRPARYWLALGLFVLALLTKTVTATLPAALLVVFWWQRGRLGWRRDVRPLLPWFGLGATAGLLTSWVERTFIGAQGADFTLNLLERGLLAGRVIWFNLGKLVWPADLIFIYPRWTVDAAVWWQYLFPLGVLALVAALVLAIRRRQEPGARAAAAGLAGFLIFAGTLFPVLGFINVYPFIFSYVADHFQYQASLGIIVPAAAGLTLAARRLPLALRQLAPLGAAALIAVLGALTWIQCGMYRDAGTLYRETLARNPSCAMAHNNLGLVLSQIAGRLPEAISHYESALRINPRYADAHLNLGSALARIPGRLSEAIAEDEAALRIFPDLADAHKNLGVALSQISGRLPEAVDQFEAAVRLRPGSAEMHDNLGVALISNPARLPEATDHLETAVRINPGSAAMHRHLGVALAKNPGRLPEAIEQFEAAVRLDPGSADAHDHLGKILLQVPGKLSEAIAHLEAAVRLDPDSADRHGGLGSALLKVPERFPEAITEFEAVVRINPESFEAHFVLGMLLSGLPDRRPEALAHFEAALRIKPDFEPAREGIARLQAARP